ncbi:MAG: pitrilysin family protein [Candidatus Neomarinimicrobiota bacterium]
MRKITVYITCLLILLSFSHLIAQKPDRSNPPTPGPIPGFKIPQYETLELSNGLPVLLLEKHDIPLVQVSLVIKGGAVFDSDKSGLSNLTVDMLDESVDTLDALQFADAVSFLGADLSTDAGRHTAVISLNTPVSRLTRALELMSGVLLRPVFKEEDLERLRIDRLTQMRQWRQEARDIAGIQYSQALYGKEHPYGIPLLGSEKVLKSLEIDDLKTFHNTYFKPNNSMLVIVGDITKNDIIPQLEQVLSDWKPKNVPTQSLFPVRQVEKRHIYLVDKPGAPQSEIRIGRIGVERTNPDYFPIVVMNTILGGSFTSRLNQNLREEHGYSYGARSSFSFRPDPGPFTAYAAVHTDVTKEALMEFMKELNGILERVSDEELDRAKKYVALRYPSRFQTISGTANQLVEKMIYALPDDYFDHYVENILSVTKEDVNRVARKYIKPEAMVIVIVGDREKILEGVKSLSLGEISTMTIEDVLGSLPEIK